MCRRKAVALGLGESVPFRSAIQGWKGGHMAPRCLPAFTIRTTSRLGAATLLFIAATTTTTACGKPVTCASGLSPYNDHCLSQAAITFLDCTAGRGFDTSTKISGSLSGFKSVVGASLDLAREDTQKENTDASLVIVHFCTELAGKQPDLPQKDREAAKVLSNQADQLIKEYHQTSVPESLTLTVSSESPTTQSPESPHIDLSPARAVVGETVVVSGTNFDANEAVDISVEGAFVTQQQADSVGTFNASIQVPSGVSPGSSITIKATGETSGKSAESPFEVASDVATEVSVSTEVTASTAGT